MSDPSIKILLVEDNDDDALLLRSMMGRRGSVAAKLERAKSVREAEEFLAPENFDIILLDLVCPTPRGSELCAVCGWPLRMSLWQS